MNALEYLANELASKTLLLCQVAAERDALGEQLKAVTAERDALKAGQHDAAPTPPEG